MFKKILTLCFLFLLTNCTTPTSAFLGPIFTGAKTGSIYQASLSYGSNKIIRDLRKLEKKNIINNTELKDLFTSTFDRNPKIISVHKNKEVKLLEIFDEEPLP